MGFFGEVIDADHFQVPIPENYHLHLLQAVVDPEELKKKSKEPIILYMKTELDERPFAICILNPAQHQYQCALTHVLSTEDEPVTFYSTGGNIHLTGNWTWDEEDDQCGGCCVPGEDDEEDDEDDDEEEDYDSEEEDEEEPPELVELEEEEIEEPETKKESNKNKKRKLEEGTKPTKNDTKDKEEPVAEEKSEKKPKIKSLKKWKVHPEGDEGIEVPETKTVRKGNGLEITDFIIGSGDIPKPGATVKILYEGLFPDGTCFDSKLRKKSPFLFRKGTNQVIKGLDLGLEGMRIGGARELLIPPALG